MSGVQDLSANVFDMVPISRAKLFRFVHIGHVVPFGIPCFVGASWFADLGGISISGP